MELEIDREMALDNGEELSSDEEQIYEPEVQQQKVAADFKSLDEMVSSQHVILKIHFLSINVFCVHLSQKAVPRLAPHGVVYVFTYSLGGTVKCD